ncbi:hypothetical protein VKT23_011132 [Stygiomarasmius scandens]|uniref:Heterokaryon incompatibility domain-containing protein n=1 Tax=Marasmiellus scandens TaxID=2682957 RepID=A0ABR1JCN3_9AGAR
MRLLHTETFELKEFYNYIPPYAILSHTWDKKEVTFQDMHNMHKLSITQLNEGTVEHPGWAKIRGACKYARKYRFQWIWIDSCCINKESSAELSEAINSMYRYYLDAHVCYVYLSDAVGISEEDPRDANSKFRHSRWFTRGWTLQELLAPSYVVFLGKTWSEIGTKSSLRDAISGITSIPKHLFEGGDINDYSIAQKMSWAALRKTTRPEDQAYCLMGIFGINMSPIYGEGGAKAFMRLQQEIIRISDDRSIFAWAALENTGQRGLLASSPQEFAMSGEVGASKSGTLGKKSSFSFNNNGLHIHLPLIPVESTSEKDVFLASLHCQSKMDGSYISVYLHKLPDGERYIRCHTSKLPLTSELPLKDDPDEIVVVQDSLFHPGHYGKKRVASHEVEALAPDQDCVFHVIRHPQYVSLFKENSAVKDFQYQFTSAGLVENFSFYFSEQHFENTGWHDRKKCPNLSDRTLHPLKSGGVIAAALHVTPSSFLLEVNWIPTESPQYPILTKQITMSPAFLVSNQNARMNLTSIFPPDYCKTEIKDKQTYIVSMPGTENNPPDRIFRLLVYKYFSDVIFIALGFHSGRVWADINAFPSRSPPPSEKIWDSYLDGGSRAKSRLKLRTSACCQLFGGKLTVEAKKRDKLQRGTYSVNIQWD